MDILSRVPFGTHSSSLLRADIIIPMKIAAAFVLFAYLAVGGMGFLFAAHAGHHSHGYDCPFMVGDQSLCAMDIFEHVSSWRSMFTASVPVFFVLAFLAFAAAAIFYLFESLAPPSLELARYKEEDSFHIYRSQYALAFARGIIHPKDQ